MSAQRFRKRPVEVEASQWFKNGDYPGENAALEGLVIRYYRNPCDPGDRKCGYCDHTMHHHGWIDTREGGHIVCPGDWIVTGVKGERYPCKPDIFKMTYEAIGEAAPVDWREEALKLRRMLTLDPGDGHGSTIDIEDEAALIDAVEAFDATLWEDCERKSPGDGAVHATEATRPT